MAGNSLMFRLADSPNHEGKDLQKVLSLFPQSLFGVFAHFSCAYIQLLKDILEYTIMQERAYPGADSSHKLYSKLPDFKELSWAQVRIHPCGDSLSRHLDHSSEYKAARLA